MTHKIGDKVFDELVPLSERRQTQHTIVQISTDALNKFPCMRIDSNYLDGWRYSWEIELVKE